LFNKACLVLLLLVPTVLYAQEVEESEIFKHHRVAVMISQTHIPKGFQSGGASGSLIVPSWGLNYEYWINRKWAIGLHNDMEITTYIIEDENGAELERSRPLIIALVGIYNPWKGLEFVLGFGREFEENKKFWVYRFGLEYEIEIGGHWDIAPALVFDIKENLYDSWTIGLAVGRRL